MGLINALRRLEGYSCAKSTLAALSVRAERDLMRENVGIQDQIACAYGGFNLTTINKDGQFVVSPVELTKIQDYLLLFYTGISRTASTIAAEQIKQHQTGNIDEQMHQMQKMPHQAIRMLYEERFSDFGELLHEAWLLKRSLASNITSPFIDSIYNRARVAGAWGGKVLGAGGGGHMLFCAPPERHDAIKQELKDLLHVPFKFEDKGSQIIFAS